ncbi:nicotinate-nucleotide adenylyltransferase [Psychroserpens sp.]|uniref:nicotinate-nucleotide adenylyltransferase n=1 Tax=Psychroserpens sp. TaxID=2020870 RepID=UPI002B26FCD0|nr:nicotinate-nucleotide adenylyltransferase [Psychroserpens sp.]
MKKLFLGLFLMGLTTQMFAQELEHLPEVVIVHNYKYLSDVGIGEEAIPVKELQLKVSDFNIKELDIYSDEYEFYDVYFFIPEGKILASYDKDGNLLRTIERYKDIDVPSTVLEAIGRRFPKWSISKNVYLVNYHETGKVRKLYKLTLENGDQRIKVKLNHRGVFQ